MRSPENVLGSLRQHSKDRTYRYERIYRLLYPQLKSHLILGKEHGITKEEAVEIVTQLAFYCGWPKAWSTFPMIAEVWPDEE